MEIIGRLTADSEVKTVGNGKQVVNFSIAVNDSYKPKDGERVEITTYVDCSFWGDVKRTQWLKKGAMVLLTGRIGTNAYVNKEGKAVARLTLHVNNINILLFAKKDEQPTTVKTGFDLVPDISELPKEDLPF
ncbi:single-stranded DNA-binding protein [Flavobacterium lindanitolerans]|uniref:single-stranded DNA-binding protein n=1 Tax=Flavobacterium lindanitolerans TaxID=428988 RepID=UPI0023F2D1B3|nr:single-stranded DNA-binding protein [Flavobacterium lindanitolerans]